MRYKEGQYVNINSQMLSDAIKKSGLDQTRLSTMLLGKNNAYISQSIVRGTFDKDELQKLCTFLGIEYKLVVVTAEMLKQKEIVNPKDNVPIVPQLETLICGTNLMYENQGKMIELMEQMLIEIKALNAKQNRLENALGQIVQNSIMVKDNTAKLHDDNSSIKSTLNLINGRVKDITDVMSGKRGIKHE